MERDRIGMVRIERREVRAAAIPAVGQRAVFVTETHDKKTEVVRALDRRTGEELWKHDWVGSISVPFYAKSRGDWIRATPAFDGETLFVAIVIMALVTTGMTTPLLTRLIPGTSVDESYQASEFARRTA